MARHDHVLEALDGFLLELDHFPAMDAVEMVVVGAADHGLVDAAAAVEVVPVNEARLADQGERAIDRGLRDGRAALAEKLDELVGPDMPLDGEELLDDAPARPRELEPAGPHELRDRLELFLHSYMRLSLSLSNTTLPDSRASRKKPRRKDFPPAGPYLEEKTLFRRLTYMLVARRLVKQSLQ